jgi:tetratricopeptide (TPR) repeat protein
VIRKFTNNPSRFDAYLGLAKTYIETGDYDKVPEILKLLERYGGISKSLKKDMNLTYSHLKIKSGQPEEAISYLKTALEYRMPKKEKVRSNYILAQLLAGTGKNEEAEKLFRRVVKMHPSPEMAFNARISALEMTTADFEEANKKLYKLLDDPINDIFRDRIYFALGQISLKQNFTDEAIDNFRQSVLYSTENTKQRAMSSLTVAKILFEQNNYELASAYYDSTVAVIDPGYPGYSAIMSRAANLKRLVDNLFTISREDSLQRLAAMPETDRNNLIANMINEIQQKEQEELNAERAEMSDQNYFRAQQYRQMPGARDNTSNLWYFYNPSTAGMGKNEFQRIWGRRRLEDNWRRKNKVSVNQEEAEQMALEVETVDSVKVKQKVADPKSKEYYLQDIPLSDSLMQVSNDRIKNSYFDAGRIYRSAFSDYPRSIEMNEELIRRFPGSIYELPAWIELHQMFEQNKDEQKMAYYRDLITRNYPESRYANYLLNPNYFKELEEQRAKIDAKFAQAVDQYSKRNFNEAGKIATEVLEMKPDSGIIAKAEFIKLTSGGSKQGNETFLRSLDKYISAFPDASTTGIALKIRDLLKENSLADYQQLLTSGYISENIVNDELKSQANGDDEFGGKFSYDDDMFHYYVVAFPKQAGVEVNRLVFDIANYNIDYYTSTDFDVESVSLNPKTQMVVVRSMPNKDEGLIYFKSIIRKRPVFKTLSGIEYNNFTASSSNYRTIIADKDYTEYLKFFMKNYSPYIGSDYPKDEIAPPEELLAKAREAEQPVEKGKFVMLKPEDIPQDNYQINKDAQHTFVITVKDSALSLAPVVAQFINFNSTFHPNEKITVKSGKIDGQQALLVTGIGNSEEAMVYFREVIANRDLFSELEETEYSNFVISGNNEKILEQKNDIKGYVAFFRENYLKVAKEESAPKVASPFDDYTGPVSI